MENRRGSKMSCGREEVPNIFSSMHSLLKPSHSEPRFRHSLLLPDIFSSPEERQSEKAQGESGRKCKKVTACPHFNKRHYAKNMCSNCYHKMGRTKQPWECSHHDRLMYAKGLCQQCYLQQYHDNKIFSRLRSREREEE